MDNVLAEPIRQLGNELAKVAMNMTPTERLVFYRATHEAAAQWLREHDAREATNRG